MIGFSLAGRTKERGLNMDENEILVPEYQKVKIGAKTYDIGTLGVDQQILLMRFLTKKVLSNQDKLKMLKERTGGDTTNMQDLSVIYDLIDRDDIFELFSILLNEPDIEYLKGKNVLNLENETEIIAIILEQNDFNPVKKNIMRITKALTRTKMP